MRHGMRFLPLLALLAAIALVVAAAGCGGDDDGGSGTAADTKTVAESGGPEAGDVVAAVAFVNDAGYHDMAEAIAAGELEARYVSTVRKTEGVIGSVEWPGGVTEQVEAFGADLAALGKALESMNRKAAAKAGEAAHESQHAFSEAAVGALEGLEGEAAVAGVLGAVNYVNGAGFHDMSEELAKGNLEPFYLDKVGGVIGVVDATAWPEQLASEVEAFGADLGALERALADVDGKAAAKAGEAVHGSQHDFSGAAVAELGALPGGPETSQAIAGITYLDAVGFHDMSEALAGGELEPHYAEQVADAVTVAEAVEWSGELAGPMRQLKAELAELKKALDAQNVKAAAAAAEGVHASQHGVSDGLLAVLGVEAEEEGHTAAAADGQRVTVEITDWAFERPEIEVREGDVTLEIVNRGEMPHGIYLQEFKVNESVAAGETEEVTFHADEAGTFQFICSDPMCGTAAQHAGMIGTLTVSRG